jgi:putative flippase GtrA
MTGTGPVAAFIRFVLCGGGVTLLGSGALLLVGDRVPLAAANAVVTVVTTVLATELHGRITFRRGRATWSDHCASGLTVLLSYLFTTGALLAFGALHPGSGALLRQGVYLAASGAAGIARFLLLRCVVFAQRPVTGSPAAPRPVPQRLAAPRPATPRSAVPPAVIPRQAGRPQPLSQPLSQPLNRSRPVALAT